MAEVEIMRVHVATGTSIPRNGPRNFRHYFRLAERELGKTFRAERSEFDFEAFPK